MDSSSQPGFRGLNVWQKAMDAADAIYAASRSFPREERFGLTSQLRRAACSVPMNIAEGYRRKANPADYMKFLRYANGSAAETETATEIAQRQRYLQQDAALELVAQYQEIGRMLGGLIARIERGNLPKDSGAAEEA
ncbi:MAG: four helix bundle protein [Planctomycetes bacterium]|nr:four helix bundle protein [Planctomycetota bacterium]